MKKTSKSCKNCLINWTVTSGCDLTSIDSAVIKSSQNSIMNFAVPLHSGCKITATSTGSDVFFSSAWNSFSTHKRRLLTERTWIKGLKLTTSANILFLNPSGWFFQQQFHYLVQSFWIPYYRCAKLHTVVHAISCYNTCLQNQPTPQRSGETLPLSLKTSKRKRSSMVGNTRPRRKSPRSCVKVPPLRNCALTSPHGPEAHVTWKNWMRWSKRSLWTSKPSMGVNDGSRSLKWPLKSKRPQVLLWLGDVSLILVSRWAILTHTKSPWVKKTSSTRIFFRWNSAPALKCSLAVRHSRHCLHPTWQMVPCSKLHGKYSTCVCACVCEIIST